MKRGKLTFAAFAKRHASSRGVRHSSLIGLTVSGSRLPAKS